MSKPIELLATIIHISKKAMLVHVSMGMIMIEIAPQV